MNMKCNHYQSPAACSLISIKLAYEPDVVFVRSTPAQVTFLSIMNVVKELIILSSKEESSAFILFLILLCCFLISLLHS